MYSGYSAIASYKDALQLLIYPFFLSSFFIRGIIEQHFLLSWFLVPGQRSKGLIIIILNMSYFTLFRFPLVWLGFLPHGQLQNSQFCNEVTEEPLRKSSCIFPWSIRLRVWTLWFLWVKFGKRMKKEGKKREVFCGCWGWGM